MEQKDKENKNIQNPLREEPKHSQAFLTCIEAVKKVFIKNKWKIEKMQPIEDVLLEMDKEYNFSNYKLTLLEEKYALSQQQDKELHKELIDLKQQLLKSNADVKNLNRQIVYYQTKSESRERELNNVIVDVTDLKMEIYKR